MRVSSIKYFVLRIVVLIVLPLFLSGCIGFGLGGGNGSGGDSDLYEKGAVAKGFPNVPLFPKSQIVESYANDGSYGASFVTSEGLSKVVGFYSENLPKVGWENQLVQNSDTNFTFNIKSDTHVGTVIVNKSADPKKTAITMSLWQKDKAP